MKALKLFNTFIPRTTELLGRAWDQTLARIDSVQKGKVEEVAKEFAEWPRDMPAYTECVDQIVSVGVSAPVDAITSLLGVLPAKDKMISANPKIAKQLGGDSGNEVQCEMRLLLLQFFFADTATQLVTFADCGFNHPRILDIGLGLVAKEYGKNIESRFRGVLDTLLMTVLRQYSVLNGHFAKEVETFQVAVDALAVVLDEEDKNYAKKAKYCVLYRYLRHPPSSILGFYKKHVSKLLSKKGMAPYLPIVYDLIYSLLMQLKKTPHDQLTELYKLFAKPDACIKKRAIEFQAILVARDEGTNMASVIELFEKVPKDIENKAVIRAFLTVLRGDNFFPDNEFWEYGDKNHLYNVENEMTQLLFPEQPQETRFKDCFCCVFDAYIKDKMDGSDVATQIIFNLFSRKLVASVSCLLDAYLKMSIDDIRIAPFLRALTLVFDPSNNFISDLRVKEGEMEVVKTAMKSLMEQKRKSYTPPPMSPYAYGCKTVSVQTAPNTISPYDPYKPEGANQGSKERISNAEAHIVEQFVMKDVIESNLSIRMVEKGDSNAPIGKTAIFLISLIYQTVNQADASTELFLPFVQSAISSDAELAFFALYALQVYYINKPFTVRPILSAINRVLIDVIGTQGAFTLLNLLYQLLSLPRMVVTESDKEWFKEWTTELQALLLAHLASPYVEVRDLVLLVMQRFDTIASDYDVDVTITSLLAEFRGTMSHRVLPMLSIYDTASKSADGLYFEDAARSQNLLLHVNFLAEYVSLLMRPELKSVFACLWKFNLQKAIELPLNPKEKGIDEIGLLSRVLPVLALTSKFAPMKPETAKALAGYRTFLKPEGFIYDYKLDDKFLVAEEGELNILTGRASFIDSVTQPLINLMLSGSRWADHVLTVIATTSNIELAGIFLNKISSSFSKVLTDPKTGLQNSTKLLRLVRAVAASPDAYLIGVVHPTAAKAVFSDILPWCHHTLTHFGVKCGLDSATEFDKTTMQKFKSFFLSYCTIVASFVKIFGSSQDPSKIGAIRGPHPTPWTDVKSWPLDERRQVLAILASLARSSSVNAVRGYQALSVFLENVPVFEKPKHVTRYLSELFLSMESKNMKVMKFILANHREQLFLQYCEQALTKPSAEGYFFFRAIASLFVGKSEVACARPLTELDKAIGQFFLDRVGCLLSISFIFLSSSHDESRKVAFEFLYRVSPLIVAYAEPTDTTNSSAINTYLKQHKANLCDQAFPPSGEELYSLAEVYATHAPTVTHKMFRDLIKLFLKDDGFIRGDHQLATTLLNTVAPFGRNVDINRKPCLPDCYGEPSSYTAFKLVEGLVGAFSSLSKTNHMAYTRIFKEMCSRESNVTTLVEMLVRMGVAEDSLPAIETICLCLVQIQPAVVLQLLCQPLTFGSWFAFHVSSRPLVTSNPYTPPDWMKLTLAVLREVAQSNITLLFPYIHTILHFCLIYYNNDKHLRISEIRLLFETVLREFPTPLAYPPDMKISFTSRMSTAQPIRQIIEDISAQLSVIFPLALDAWSREALQWLACCGDLVLAAESGAIYACTLRTVTMQDALPIMYAMEVVLCSSTDLDAKAMKSVIFPYIRSALSALSALVELAATQGKASLMVHVFNFAAHFINAVGSDLETAEAALRIMNIFVTARIVTSTEQIAPQLTGVARILPLAFNSTAVSSFLGSLIVCLPSQGTQTLKAMSVAMLLPAYYAVVSAYHSIDPYSTFVSDATVIQLFNMANILATAKFGGEARYSDIFGRFVGNPQGLTPTDFIDELTIEMWNSDPTVLASVGKLYAEMCKMNVPTISSAIFSVTESFLETVPEKNTITEYFADVLLAAIADNSPAAQLLMHTFNEVAMPGGFFSSDTPADLPLEYDPANDMKILTRRVRSETECNQKKFVTDGDLTIQDAGCVIPMIPLVEQLTKPREDLCAMLKHVKVQPFEHQESLWADLQQGAPKHSRSVKIEPTSVEMLRHSRAESVTSNDNVWRFTLGKPINPQAFILRDEEFDEFEKRLSDAF